MHRKTGAKFVRTPRVATSENTCDGVSFDKVAVLKAAAWRSATLLSNFPAV